MSVTTVTSSQLASYRAASSADMKRAVGKRLREAGLIIADAAKAISAEFSTKIPGSIKVTGGTTEVFIVAGGDAAPNAYPIEYGKFHPVYATGARNTWHWSKKPMDKRPFLEEAAASAGDAAAEAFAAVLDDWIAQL